MWVRVLALSVFLVLAFAQTPTAIPAERFGLSVLRDSYAVVFKKEGLELVYVEGIGWAPPLEPTLPPPNENSLPLEVVRAAGLVQVPQAGVRFSGGAGRLRLVFDLPEALPLEKREGSYPGRLSLELPYFLPDLETLRLPPELGLEFRYLPHGTQLSLQAPTGRLYRYRQYTLEDPWRLVLDFYYLQPETREVLSRGISYLERWAWTPEPLRLYMIQADPGSWRMEPVGQPGLRKPLKQMAPTALALLNGGYFDNRTATPIGLWIQDGVALNFPFGRSALLWGNGQVFGGFPKFGAWVEVASGQRYPVGVNLWRARLTAHTTPGPAGRPGENVAIVEQERVIATLPAPAELKPGQWGLSFPASDTPIARTGETLKLRMSLEPPVQYALEAGPLLIQAGQNVFDPKREPFTDPRPLGAVTPQSAVAWTLEGGVWLVVSEATTPAVLAQALQSLGAWGAIRMDGGGSSQLYVRGVLRSPLIESRPRPVVNGLALYPKAGP
ncbi:phosphodiester glycosidase family protein [Calidithermus timidus]|jgi:hypothetical protein|uniref:phosphodiester glycosidase family protein n=1 Tax=Calidithermus timidus TaxID=307124 RepID=UPI000369BEFC|nr:phosphodiester glycosidase family protein [Calidithermus timidus]